MLGVANFYPGSGLVAGGPALLSLALPTDYLFALAGPCCTGAVCECGQTPTECYSVFLSAVKCRGMDDGLILPPFSADCPSKHSICVTDTVF